MLSEDKCCPMLVSNNGRGRLKQFHQLVYFITNPVLRNPNMKYMLTL